MKKVLLLGSTFISLLSCQQRENIKVEKSDLFITRQKHLLEQISKKETKIINKVNASVEGLKQLNDESYQAFLFINNEEEEEDLFSDVLIFSKEEKKDIDDNKISIFIECKSISDSIFLEQLKKSSYNEISVKLKGNCVELNFINN